MVHVHSNNHFYKIYLLHSDLGGTLWRLLPYLYNHNDYLPFKPVTMINTYIEWRSQPHLCCKQFETYFAKHKVWGTCVSQVVKYPGGNHHCKLRSSGSCGHWCNKPVSIGSHRWTGSLYSVGKMVHSKQGRSCYILFNI